MWIGDVDVPLALIEAHKTGRLVIFVGAGASRGAPANLPDFRTLTSQIAAEAQVAPGATDLDQPDVFLGRLDDGPVDVHGQVARHLGLVSSHPNPLHEAIARLALAGPAIRLVTTNYDEHLSRTLSTGGAEVDEYQGPALPLGDDFTGLVYLHGRLSQEPRHLVVTDRDFGRAYLTAAWAARFLERMFATYSVLFIGYSHSDVVMRYLARALGPTTAGRFVLTDQPGEPDWKRLGLQPVGFPNAEGTFSALTDAIAGWASWASMGLLAHRQRIADLVAVPPSPVPEEASYLEHALTDQQTVPLFVELARGEQWLLWAARQSEFQRLFHPAAEQTACTAPLARWFAQYFVMDEGLSAVALAVVRDAGGRLGPTLRDAIGHRLHIAGRPRNPWLGPWLLLLVDREPAQPTRWLEYALTTCRWPEDRSDALLLFDQLTQPQAVLQPSYGLEEPPRFDIALPGSAHWLAEAWDAMFRPHLDDAAPDLLAIAERHLRLAHHLLTTGGSARPGWDPLSFRRSAVEPHPQDDHREPIDVLVDAARDCLEWLLDSHPDDAGGNVALWSASDVPLLRRLAIHGWTHRTDVDANAKLEWLRSTGWLFDTQLQHEVFALIAATLATAGRQVADALVAEAVAGPPGRVDNRHREYARYNALAWMTRQAPDLESAARAFEELQTAHPEFAEREHPDMLVWSATGSFSLRPPLSPEELHALIAADPAAALNELRRYRDVEDPFEGPTWRDALASLVETVQQYPHDGVTVLDSAQGDDPDVAGAVVRGWTGSDVEDNVAIDILERLLRLNAATVADELAHLLSQGGQGQATPTEWHRFDAARRLAGQVWDTLDGTAPLPDQADDWLQQAVNHPAGELAEFWIHAVAADWQAAGDSWTGLPGPTRDNLDRLLRPSDGRTAFAEIILASQLRFFHGADSAWCEAQLLPLLDWTDPTRAQRTWSGFLFWGRGNDQLLAAGLLRHYLAAVKHIGELPEGLRRQLCVHFAGVALSSELDPVAWTREFTAKADVPMRVEWLHQITWMLDGLPDEAIARQWSRWMEAYWRDRLNSIPVVMTIEEASAMAAWTAHLPEPIDTAVGLATAHPARLEPHSDLLADVDEHLDRGPAQYARLLGHLLKHTEQPFWECHALAEVVPRLRLTTDPADIEVIIEHALRLGCPDAPSW